MKDITGELSKRIFEYGDSVQWGNGGAAMMEYDIRRVVEAWICEAFERVIYCDVCNKEYEDGEPCVHFEAHEYIPIMTDKRAIEIAERTVKNILGGEKVGWNNGLHWAANWIEVGLQGETNERTLEFGRNMAMSIRAARRDK